MRTVTDDKVINIEKMFDIGKYGLYDTIDFKIGEHSREYAALQNASLLRVLVRIVVQQTSRMLTICSKISATTAGESNWSVIHWIAIVWRV